MAPNFQTVQFKRILQNVFADFLTQPENKIFFPPVDPQFIFSEKILQRDVSQVQVCLIYIKLSQNIDWVDYNVN